MYNASHNQTINCDLANGLEPLSHGLMIEVFYYVQLYACGIVLLYYRNHHHYIIIKVLFCFAFICYYWITSVILFVVLQFLYMYAARLLQATFCYQALKYRNLNRFFIIIIWIELLLLLFLNIYTSDFSFLNNYFDLR
jgi:hypothetical protein